MTAKRKHEKARPRSTAHPLYAAAFIYWVAQKVSHLATSEISLYRIQKPVDQAIYFSLKFECKRSTRIVSIGIKYSMRDPIGDVINCLKVRCVYKKCVDDKIVIET